MLIFLNLRKRGNPFCGQPFRLVATCLCVSSTKGNNESLKGGPLKEPFVPPSLCTVYIMFCNYCTSPRTNKNTLRQSTIIKFFRHVSLGLQRARSFFFRRVRLNNSCCVTINKSAKNEST